MLSVASLLNCLAIVLALAAVCLGLRMVSNELAVLRRLVTILVELGTTLTDLEIKRRIDRIGAREGRPAEEVFRELEERLRRNAS